MENNDFVNALLQVYKVLMPLRIIEIMLALFFYDSLMSLITWCRVFFSRDKEVLHD